MAITSGFFKSIGGDRKYTADFFTSYFASLVGNGVFPNPSTNLQVLSFQNMQTRVAPGKAWINGNYMVNDADFIIQHANASGSFPRIDRIVVSLNFDMRDISVYVKAGTPSSSPIAPSLTRDSTIYELGIADVLIPSGATQIQQTNITDTRLNSELCGIVRGLITEVDTTTIFNQYQQAVQQVIQNGDAQFNQFLSTSQAEFDEFFADLNVTLSGDVAANLTARIIAIENSKATTAQAQAGLSNQVLMTPKGVSDYTKQFGIGGMVINTLNDVNDLKVSGHYRFQNGRANLPTNNSAYDVIVIVTDNAFGIQLAISEVTRMIYVRSILASTWGNWSKVYGEVDRASTAQALAGTDDNLVMTPAKVKSVADLKLDKSGGTLTGNLSVVKGVPSLDLTVPNTGSSLNVRLNASNLADGSAEFLKNGQSAMQIVNSIDVRFFHPTMGVFSVQDAIDIITGSSTTPTAPIRNGKFVGVYE